MKTLLALILMLTANLATAQTITVDPKRTMYIKGAIGGNIIYKAQELMVLAQTKKPIYLIINSPGGSVYPGLQFITAMQIAKHRGIKIKCIVPIMAASMGFQFLVNCSERYAFKNSLLLWHPMKITMRGAASHDKLLYETREMSALEKPLLRHILRELNISRRTFRYHYRHETMWTARRLKNLSPDFLTIIKDVKGAKNLFKMR